MKNKTALQPIATWYQTSKWSIVIEAVKVVSFTEKTATIIDDYGGERRQDRCNSWRALWPTWEEAVESIKNRIESTRNEAEEELRQCDLDMAKVLKLKKPKEV